MTNEFAIAVHVLVFLHKKAQTMASEALAEHIHTNPVCIRKVMGKLKKAGFVETREGLNGGYKIVADAKEVTLNDIGKALDVDMVKAGWHSGNPEKKCKVSCGMVEVLDGVVDGLNEKCREYLASITIEDIEKQIESMQ